MTATTATTAEAPDLDHHDIMARVRDTWCELVSDASGFGPGSPPDSAVARTFREVVVGLLGGAHLAAGGTDAFIRRTVRGTPEFLREHRHMVDDIVHSISGADERIDYAMFEDCDSAEDVVAVFRNRGAGRPADGATESVDEGFMARFVAVYGREPFVREYFAYARRGPRTSSEDLGELHDVYVKVLTEMRALYRDYLGQTLSEARFLEKFIDRFRDADVVLDERNRVLNDEAYETAMKGRITDTYAMLFDCPLDPEETEHIYARVRARELPLDYPELSSMLCEHNREGKSIRNSIAVLWEAYLNRPPDEDELAPFVHPWRVDADTTEQIIRSQLARSIEFFSELAARARVLFPGTPRPQLFRDLARAKESADVVDIAGPGSDTSLDDFLKRHVTGSP